MLAGHKEILEDLHLTNDSLLTTKTNATIKRLTILSFIMLPLTLISGIFGMNSDISFIENTQEFFLVICAMISVAIIMFLYFKSRKYSLSTQQKNGLNALVILVFVQFGLGVFTLLFAVPLWLGLTHQIVAFFLLTAMTYTLHRLSK